VFRRRDKPPRVKKWASKQPAFNRLNSHRVVIARVRFIDAPIDRPLAQCERERKIDRAVMHRAICCLNHGIYFPAKRRTSNLYAERI
jgi:hypothetical protein